MDDLEVAVRARRVARGRLGESLRGKEEVWKSSLGAPIWEVIYGTCWATTKSSSMQSLKRLNSTLKIQT